MLFIKKRFGIEIHFGSCTVWLVKHIPGKFNIGETRDFGGAKEQNLELSEFFRG